jgi:outer membrane receptor protein involved in Fe transport
MQPFGRALRFGAAVGALLLGGTQVLAAQGVTSAAVQGRIISESRGTVESGIVALTNTSTGTRQQTTTNSAGRYTFENVPPGGPYTMEIRAIGFQPATKTGIVLTLGQRYVQDFELKQSVVTLEELTIIAATNPLINSGRTGPAQSVSDTSIQRIPILGRNFTSLLNMSPQVTPNNAGGFSIGGQNPRFNTIMIDGSVDNDLFGLAAGGGVPGARVGGKALSLEALKEFQILTAPFDVRQGGFSGGLVNGITKSGSNEFHGSMFGYVQRPELVGKDTALAKVTTFDIKQYGGTLGGPIIRNKLHFFVAVDVQSRQSPLFSAEVTQPTTGITRTTADRVRQITIAKAGFDPGGPEPPTLDQPDNSYFGKLNWQIGGSTQLEVSGNIVNASADNLARGTRNRVDRDGFQLSNSGFNFVDHTRNIRSKLNTIIGKANLELLFGRTTIADNRTIPNQVPLILVQGDVANNYIAAGGEKFSQANTLDQKIHEATANLTFPLGRHEITVGSHNEFFSFVNVFWQGRYGVWTFADTTAYNALTPNRYEIQLALRPNGPIADFSVKQYGGYLQDRWTLADNLTLTGGLRIDVPSNPHPVANPLKQLVDTLGVHTDRFPTGNHLWSPRLGFNWDPGANGNTIVRGGVGVFTGRPPYVWISNAFTNTGLDQTTLICTPASGGVPTFTVDVNNMPRTCAGGAAVAPPAATVNYFDDNFKWQQALKYSLGVDQKLPWGMVATGDFLETRGRNTLYQTDDNVRLGAVNGEGRQLYATANPAGSGSLRRLKQTDSVAAVVHHSNRGGDFSRQFTFQLAKRFSNGVEFNAAYTHSEVMDLMTFTSDIATSNLQNTALDGPLEHRNLRTSGLSVPHKISVSATGNLPFGLQGSLLYTARAGSPYAYTVNGDANGDGMTVNDLVYVPKDATDISLVTAADWDRLNAFIVSEPCLREQRGRIMERNSCRNPWTKFLDIRLSKVVPTLSGQRFEIQADVFNFLNILNREWGWNRQTNTFETRALLNLASYDTRGTASEADDRGRYTLNTTNFFLRQAQTGSSRWRVQLGGKYTF